MAPAMSEHLKKRAVVLLSGGLDSMVCAALAREAGFAVLALIPVAVKHLRRRA